CSRSPHYDGYPNYFDYW
nr:immunoglobulin heavy chain junction region [Mus musculus]MBK4195020.1 immunoglobulin heavy chain junction region [Mus musculus]MBK4195021.1 immunoglobulin heavy chain junction region [Mus musculus]MBK4195022.1 immunoglobulin heavy chain junction region [Mus musculus]MBK4195023.1 immunoglobulin heavy chain junction region [Mus musculus]